MTDTVLALVADLVGESPAAGDRPTPGDRGDLGENPRRCCADSEATAGDFGRLLGDPAGDIAESRPESPRVAPPETRATSGESPESPRSPVARDGASPEPMRATTAGWAIAGDIAPSRPKSPRVAPPPSRTNQGKSPESPVSPARGDENAPAPIPPELVARLRKAAKRIVWAACQWYASDAADLVRFTDEELELLVGDYLLKRHIARVSPHHDAHAPSTERKST